MCTYLHFKKRLNLYSNIWDLGWLWGVNVNVENISCLILAGVMLLYSSCFWKSLEEYTTKFLLLLIVSSPFWKFTSGDEGQIRFGSIWTCFWVSPLGERKCCRHLVGSSRDASNILWWMRQESKQIIIWLKMFVVLALRNSGLDLPDLLDSINWLVSVLL